MRAQNTHCPTATQSQTADPRAAPRVRQTEVPFRLQDRQMENGQDGDAARAPLLPRLLLVDGCPGCLLEQKKAAANGAPPKMELAFVALVSLVNSLPIGSLFPFVYFMVKDFGIAQSDTMIGSYAGYIGSAMMLGRFITSAFWGMIADKYGRKPVILIGTLSIVIFNSAFGFSINFWMALITRFLLGSCNGMLGAIRAYASEICGKESQAWGLSMVGTMRGLGLVIGPAIGGYLALPSKKYPIVFPSRSLFDRFPYALPCLCISAFSIPAHIAGYWIPESRHNHPTRLVEDRKGFEEDVQSNPADLEVGDTKPASRKATGTRWQAKKEWLRKNLGMVAAMYVYCVWGLHSMAYSEVFSMWAVSPKIYGGLGFTTSQVGNVLSVTGGALLVFQLSAIVRLVKFFGALRLAQVCGVLTMILTAMYPLISNLSGQALWTLLGFVSIVKNILSACVVVGSSILMNNSVRSGKRGTANGVAASIMSLFKAVGPAIAGIIFSWSQARIDAYFLPGMWMVFTLLSLFAFLAFIPAFDPILPRSLEKPPIEVAA